MQNEIDKLEKTSVKKNEFSILALWILLLSFIVFAESIFVNNRFGEAKFKEEMAEHWHNPNANNPTQMPFKANTGLSANMLEQSYNVVAENLQSVCVSISGARSINGNLEQIHGSGFIVEGQYVITNYHVIANAQDIEITAYSPSTITYPAKVLHSDWANDLALLKIITTDQLPSAVLGNSDVIDAGDIVFAMGNAFGKGNIFTSGLVSDRNQSFSVDGRIYNNMIRTETCMYPGSSGGPLANINGEIIGINTAIYDPNGQFTGISLSTPINRVRSLLSNIQANGTNNQFAQAAFCNNMGNQYSLAA